MLPPSTRSAPRLHPDAARAAHRARPGPPRPNAAALAATLALLASLLAPGARSAPRSPVFQREDSLVRAGRWDLSRALLDSLLASARARGDSHLELQALVQRGGRSAFRGELHAGEADLLAAERLAPRLRDTTLWCAAIRARTLAYQNAGRLRDSAPLVLALLRLSRAQGDAPGVARARLLLAFQRLCEGRFARAIALYQVAQRELARCDLRGEALEADVGLARAYDGLGESDAARSAYEHLIAEGSAMSAWLPIANAWNNLGNLEMADGDPAAALADWNRARPLYDQLGKSDFARATQLNVANALEELGRHEEAAAQVAEVIRAARLAGDFDHEVRARIAIAEIRNAQGRGDEAWTDADSALRAGPALTPTSHAAAELAQVAALAGSGREREALVQVTGIEARSGGGLAAGQRARIRYTIADLELRTGRAREARRLLGAETRPSATSNDWLDRLLRSRCDVALGEREAGLVELERASAGWERWRGVPGDPEWRETRGPGARRLYEAFHALRMAAPAGSERTQLERRAFDDLQAFKARTLEERMAGRRSLPPVRVRATLAWLQRSGLAPGDLFLDFYAGSDSAFVCAVTRHAFRWVPLHETRPLLARSGRAGSLFAAREAEDAALPACDEAAQALGQSLFGGLADLVRSARRVIVCADGDLAGLPFGALEVNGEPLLARRELVLVPSATVLRSLRPALPADSPGRLLALAGAPLAGARDEVRWLARHVAGVQVLADPGAGGRAALLAQLAACGAVHVAAHTEVNVEAPWRSGIELGGVQPSAESSCLRAATIARTHLRARLAVLSGCQSYGSRGLFGEGVLGLSTAFLSAGVPAVVCTLWPVDDRATAAFMEGFYARLLRGATPAAALRAQQLETRAQPRTRHPFFWAGFVLLGDPDAAVALHGHG